MHIFSARDLRERTEDLLKAAEAGELSVVARHGQPVFVAIPFDEYLLTAGVNTALAVKLFQENVISLGKAAKFAGMAKIEFVEFLGTKGIPAEHYSVSDLDEELARIEQEPHELHPPSVQI